MTAYTQTTTLDFTTAEKVGRRGIGILSGKTALSNYNSTLAEVTTITGKFRTIYRVIAESLTSNGYVARWDTTSKAFKCYYPTKAITPAGTNSKPTFTIEASGAIGSNMEIGFSADTAGATVEGGTGITAQRALTTTSPVGTPTFTGTPVAAQAGTEVANDVDVGTINWIAIGLA